MKREQAGLALGLVLLLGCQPGMARGAGQDDPDPEAVERAAYEAALESARREQEEAQVAIERAREEIVRIEAERAEVSGQQAEQRAQMVAEQAERRAAMAEQRAAMREELSRVHEQLRQASREVAHLHRELDRTHVRVRAPTAYSFNLGDRAVIGVILGEDTGAGVQVLGVSPDGPADRAGIQQGDVIVKMMDKPLNQSGSGSARAVLNDVMNGVKAGDEIVITVRRDGEEHDITVTAEKREPFSWQSIIRLPSAPPAPDAPAIAGIVENIEIPEIDEDELRARVEAIRERLDEKHILMGTDPAIAFGSAPEDFEYRWETLSDIGDGALRQADVWFGLPATRGLKLAEMGPGLGAYFEADHGVLVLEARDDNHLQLQAGDVILAVGDKEVKRPSDLIRALREWEPGSGIELHIMRQRSDRTLEVIRPERSVGFESAPFADEFEVIIHTPDH